MHNLNKKMMEVVEKYVTENGLNSFSVDTILLAILDSDVTDPVTNQPFSLHKLYSQVIVEFESRFTAFKETVLKMYNGSGAPARTEAEAQKAARELMKIDLSGAPENLREITFFMTVVRVMINHATMVAPQYFGEIREQMCDVDGIIKSSGIESAEGMSNTPFLDKFSRNLTKEAQDGKLFPAFERENEIIETVLHLSRRDKGNVIMVGDAGIGKTAIMEGLAWEFANRDHDGCILPKNVEDFNFYILNLGELFAGTRFRGDAEERITKILDEVKKVKNPVIFIDEFHTVMTAGASSQDDLNFVNMLKPEITQGNIHIIGATTHDEFFKTIERNKAFLRRFKVLNLEEPTVGAATKILKRVRKRYEDFHNCYLTDMAIETAVKLSHKYINDRRLPDKAIDVIDMALTRGKIFSGKETIITSSDIECEIAKITHIPESNLEENAGKNLLQDLKKGVVGQDSALELISSMYAVFAAGLRDTNKPIASFLAVGPTGSGKTETAKTLATSLGMELHRFDMSEYMEPHSISRLIGAPPGYVGHDDDGELIKKMSQHPRAVVLFDEIEKAHPRVLNVLLQIMDDGRLTSTRGKVVDFRNAIILMTSNVGAEARERNQIGIIKSETFGSENQENEIKRHFRPEFRNRLDAILFYNKLSKTAMHGIVHKFIEELNQMLAEKGITITLTNSALDHLADKGYSPEMGARPLQRVIENDLKLPLAKKLISGEIGNGKAIKVTYASGLLKFKTVDDNELVGAES